MPESATLTISILRCGACGALDPGPRRLCPHCHGRELHAHDVPGEGALVSWTVIRRPPQGFAEEGSFPVAIVDLDAGVRVTGRLRDVTLEPRLGDRIACREKRGDLPIFDRVQP